jgi:hypothetical protein
MLTKSKILILSMLAIAVSFSSCTDDDDDDDDIITGNVIVSENISGEETWTKDKVYQLGGRITVLDGATLNIEAGTIIKGEAGSGPNATALLVARGGTLMAEGNENAPIIFTSVADEITPEQVASGDFKSPNLDPDINGLWGGVIVLGRAPISASNDNDEDVSEIAIEGIPATDPNGLYGGSDGGDNSGVLKYISIRHGGSNIGAGNEINGLTMGGVGTGTTIEHVEIVSNQDDGLEWFGGTVNVDNVVVWNVGDDGLDTDQGWSGTCDNFIIVTASGHNFELDGPEGSTLLDVQHTFQNGTVVHASFDNEGDVDKSAQDIINTDDNSGVILRNIFITSIPEGVNIDESTYENVTFDGVVLDVPAEDLLNYIETGAAIPGVSAGSTGTKANATVFGWTWAGQAGGLSGL